jgi:hypothetical protein
MQNPGPVPRNDFDALSASEPVAEARFVCARHGTDAGIVRLHGSEAAGWMVVVESLVGNHRERIPAPSAQPLRDAVARGDVRGIHLLDLEWAPFFCAECGASYCAECWRTRPVFDPDMPGWLEEIRGECPGGHERMLSD